MPKLVDATEQRRAIRDAARGVFARRGVTGTGLAHVADAAGMGRSSLYHYYGSKGELVRDLVRDLLVEEEAVFAEAAGAEGTPRERLERLAAGMPPLFDEWILVGRLLSELRARDARLFRPFFRRIRRQLAALIAEGQRRGDFDPALDPAFAAAAVIGVIDGLLLQVLVDRNAFPDRVRLGRDLLAVLRKVILP